MLATKPQPKAPVKAARAAPKAQGGLLAEYPPFPGMAPALHKKLAELCGPRWIDLLFHLPTRLLDRTATPGVAAANVGERATILARVTKRPSVFKSLNAPRGKKIPLVIELADEAGTPLRAVFFNPAPWLERAFPFTKDKDGKMVGGVVILSGKVESDAKGKKMIHPDVWSASAARGLSDVARIWPLYPLTAGVPQGWVGRAVQHALAHAAEAPPPEWLPPDLVAHHHWPALVDALAAAHNPQTEADLLPTAPARVRLALDELVATQLALSHARAATRFQPGIAHGAAEGLRRKLAAALPFKLTQGQRAALADIDADLSTPRPMLRLLQGDVGSGKTLVALMSLLRVIENGQQGVLMAPTEILARQLWANARRWLEPLGVSVGLLVGSLSAAQKRKIKESLKDGYINLLVGTHALAEDNVVFDKLGLAVIDEQHRFGVRQRMALSINQSLPPDMLVMTATPIPRTLALTAYGDMEVSSIRDKPPGRTPIQTLAMPDGRLSEIARAIGRVTGAGEQVYWVCPLVEESEDTDLADATTRAATLQKLYGNTVALLHGKMKTADKDAAMARFVSGEAKVLVSTTVIEVGVDVPAATLIVIEHAERFGLSQLHQLRGRVGRGSKPSRCILLYSNPPTPYAKARIEALRESDDGFLLSEKDLELRGPGEVLGTRQSGDVAHRLADLHHHKDLLPVARDISQASLSGAISSGQRGALALLLQYFDKQAAADFLRGG